MKMNKRNLKLGIRALGSGNLAMLIAVAVFVLFTAGCPKRVASAVEEHGPDDGHGHGAAEKKAEVDAKGGHGSDDGHGHGAAGSDDEDEVVLSAAAIAANKIETAPVAARTLSARIMLPGRLAFNVERTAHIGTPVSGRVAKISAQLGDAVKKDDALFVVESTAAGEAQANYLLKKSLVKTAEGALVLTSATAERGRKLKESGALSTAEIAKRDNEKAVAENVLQAAQAELKAAENMLRLFGFDDAALEDLIRKGTATSAYVVRAPIDGVVVEREVTPGEMVGPDREALVRLADTKGLWVLGAAPENRLADIATGMTAEILVDALAGKSFVGKVTYVAPALNEATRTAEVRVVLDDEAAAAVLRAGMFVRVVVNAPMKGDAGLAVPDGAVLTVENAPAVFVAVEGEPGAFSKRAIKPGMAVDGWIPVLSGLKAGEKVVVNGAFILKAELAKGVMEGKTCTGH